MDSIMAYGLPESWVSGDIKSELKTELSEADIKLLKSRYSLKQNVFEELKIKDEIEVQRDDITELIEDQDEEWTLDQIIENF